MNALQMFRNGFDYIEIAKHYKSTEAMVERAIHYQRQQERAEEKKQFLAVVKKENMRRYQREYQQRMSAAIKEARAQR